MEALDAAKEHGATQVNTSVDSQDLWSRSCFVSCLPLFCVPLHTCCGGVETSYNCVFSKL